MSQSSPVKLNQDLYSLLAEFTNHIDRGSLIHALGWRGEPISSCLKACGLAMNFVFKKPDWCDNIMEINSETKYPMPLPVLLLLGKDLPEVCQGKTRGRCLLLLVNDWTGDSRFLRKLFFECLQDHTFDKENSIVTFKGSRLKLYVHEALNATEWIPTKAIPQIISLKEEVHVVYYNENQMYKLGPDSIGGIQDYTGTKAIKEICSIKLKFRDGETVYRLLKGPKKETKVVNLTTTDAWGAKWVVGWRKARDGEHGW